MARSYISVLYSIHFRIGVTQFDCISYVHTNKTLTMLLAYVTLLLCPSRKETFDADNLQSGQHG